MRKTVRVLVVDDDITNLEVITELLEDEGYETVTAEDGSIALNILSKEDSSTFALVILDWMMPQVSGLEVLKKIKADKNLKEIPVIMQTAKAYSENIVEGMESGACHYLTKPFTKDVLMSMVKSSLKQSSQITKVAKEAERAKDSFFVVSRREKSTKLDLEAYKRMTRFFTKSLNCKEHKELVQMLLDTAKQFSFPSAGKDEQDRKLRCSVRLLGEEEINLTDRGIESQFDTKVLQRAMDSGEVIQQSTYTAIASGSGQTAILIRNTPTDENEAMRAINIVSILLERFEERLMHFENELSISKQHSELEKKNDQIKTMVRSCSEELNNVNDTYQQMKEKQMAILENMSGTITSNVQGLSQEQQEAILQAVNDELIKSMELYTEDQITDQKFLITIQNLSNLLEEKETRNDTFQPEEQLGGTSQDSVDDLLASLGM